MEVLGRTAATALPVLAIAAAAPDSWRGLFTASALAALWVGTLHAAFMLKRNELLALGVLVSAARGTIVGLIMASALAFWLPSLAVGAPTLLLMTGAIFVAVSAWESMWRRLAGEKRVLIVGTSGARSLIKELHSSGRGFRVIGVVDDDHETEAFAGVPMLGQLSYLPAAIRKLCPDIVVVALGKNRPAIFGHLLDHASAGFRVVEIAQFYEHAFGRVPVRGLTRAWFMSVLHLYQRPYPRVTKRAFDLVVAGAAFLITLPLLPIIALLVRLSTGPVLLRQVRVGENGKLFTMYKFRSMRPGAERPGEAIWASDGDPRATRVGTMLRRLRLDELPQLWNVLRGNMSIVGPRPERPEFLEQLEAQIPFWSRRQLIKPGITGWAQIRRGYTADTEGSTEKLSYDLWYLRHRSLFVDFAICLQTAALLIRGGSPGAGTERSESQPVPALEPLMAASGVSLQSAVHRLAVRSSQRSAKPARRMPLAENDEVDAHGTSEASAS